MKNLFKSIIAIMCCGAAFVACTKDEAPEIEMSVDTPALTVEYQNPVDQSVTLTTNANWILTVPDWVTASAAYGSGNTILTFSFEANYKDEKTSTASRSGEIRISGGGTLTGKGEVIIIQVNQEGYTYVDPNPSLGGITDVGEFVEFIKAANSGGSLKRWTDDNGEVVLLADINLAGTNIDWQGIADEAKVKNANNDCSIEGPAFSGIFNGNNHKITNFNPTVSLGANTTFGLFAAIRNAVVKNVELSGTFTYSATEQADAGILVGTAYNSTIQNVKLSGNLNSTGTTVAKRFSLGGICGFAAAGVYEDKEGQTLIEDCTVDVEVTAEGGSNSGNGATCVMYGGIVGFATTPNKDASYRVTIKDCVNNGNMNVTLGRCSGICATMNTGTTLQGCINNGDQVNKIADGRLGNIVCNMSHYCHLIDCVNNGDLDATVDGYKGTVGGLIALCGSANKCSITGGGNYGTIKTLSSVTKYRGLLWANHNADIPTSNVVASGRLILSGTEVEISASNYMDYIGSIKVPACVTNITWQAPK